METKTLKEINRKILTIGSIETEIFKALKNYKGEKVLLMVSRKIKALCKMNIDYNAKGFGVFKMQVDNKLKEKEFVIIELK